MGKWKEISRSQAPFVFPKCFLLGIFCLCQFVSHHFWLLWSLGAKGIGLSQTDCDTRINTDQQSKEVLTQHLSLPPLWPKSKEVFG